jgi:hypothetical protein
MKKVNLKGKLNLKKETLSKLDMTNVSGGVTAFCGTSPVLCQKSLAVLCPSLAVVCITNNGCQTLKATCTIQTLNGCSFACGPIATI